jgi:hypothetical protein
MTLNAPSANIITPIIIRNPEPESDDPVPELCPFPMLNPMKSLPLPDEDDPIPNIPALPDPDEPVPILPKNNT